MKDMFDFYGVQKNISDSQKEFYDVWMKTFQANEQYLKSMSELYNHLWTTNLGVAKRAMNL